MTAASRLIGVERNQLVADAVTDGRGLSDRVGVRICAVFEAFNGQILPEASLAHGPGSVTRRRGTPLFRARPESGEAERGTGVLLMVLRPPAGRKGRAAPGFCRLSAISARLPPA